MIDSQTAGRSRRRLPRLAWHWGPAVALAALIFTGSAHDTVELPGRTDLIAHLGAFGLLGALVLRGCADGRWHGVTSRAAWIAWVLTAAYGATDEFHQRFVIGRTPAVDDWIADVIGAGLAILALRFVARWARQGPSRGRAV